MTDFNGRVGEIAYAFERSPGDPGELRYVIRKVLRAERMDGWQEGYSDGQEDKYATYAARRDREAAPLQLAWRGTDRRGEEWSGSWQMPRSHVAAVVEDRFETHWRKLSVTLDGSEIAAIEPHPDKPGEYLWWDGAP
jgi:hypothetical protein